MNSKQYKAEAFAKAEVRETMSVEAARKLPGMLAMTVPLHLEKVGFYAYLKGGKRTLIVRGQTA